MIKWFYEHIAIRPDANIKNPDQFIWLHGWGQDHRSLKRLAQILSDKANHNLYDCPGFGQTQALDEVDVPDEEKILPLKSVTSADGHQQNKKAAGSFEYAQSLHENLSTIEDPLILVGHSFGVRIAVQYAALYPSKVKAMIFIAGAGLKKKRSVFWYLKAKFIKSLGWFSYRIDTLFKTNFLKRYRQRFGSVDYKMAGVLRKTLVRVVNEDLSQQATKIQCPVLILNGNFDQDTPVEMGKKYENLIPKGKFFEIQGFGHLDILDRGVYQLEGKIRSFLKDCVK